MDLAIARGCEFFLRHRLFRSEGGGEVIAGQFLRLRYPPYWHYDVLAALRVLARAGTLADPRVQEALDDLQRRRRPDGCWQADGKWWSPPGSRTAAEVVDWGPNRPNEMVTLNALRVLRAAGRWTPAAHGEVLHGP